MTAAGLIFSNIHDKSLAELTNHRTIASVPFGCRYRLIDFALSNMVNSNINKVGIITHNNYQSLLDHIGTGKDWDLSRRSGGIKILPPFITSFTGPEANKLYNNRLEALMGVTNFINRCNEDYIVLSDCDAVCNINIADVLAQHESNKADVTIVSTTKAFGDCSFNSSVACLESDADGRLTGVSKFKPTDGIKEISTHLMVFTRRYLLKILGEAAARDYTSLYLDIFAKKLDTDRYFVYHYEGYYSIIGSLEGYFASNMALLDPAARKQVFEVPNFPIYTKVRNSAPTKYTSNAKVKNSYIADGCVIDGIVENSIIFRGVKVGKGAVIRNSIVLQDTYIGTDVSLNCVITDKNVVVNDGRILSGHETMPFFIGKGKRV